MKESGDVVLLTQFDEAECLRRLRGALDTQRGKSIFSGKVAGEFHAQGFQLTFRANGNYQYAMPHFRGRLVQEMHGTRVEGQFTVSQFGTAFVCSFPALFIGVGVFFLVVFGRTGALGVPLAWVLILPFLLLGVLLLGMLRPIRRRHKKRLSEFLENTLMAQIEPRP